MHDGVGGLAELPEALPERQGEQAGGLLGGSEGDGLGQGMAQGGEEEAIGVRQRLVLEHARRSWEPAG